MKAVGLVVLLAVAAFAQSQQETLCKSDADCGAALGCDVNRGVCAACVPFMKCTSPTCDSGAAYRNYKTNVAPFLKCATAALPADVTCKANADGTCAISSLNLCANLRCAYGCANGKCLLGPGGACNAQTACGTGLECSSQGACVRSCKTVRCSSDTVCELGECVAPAGKTCSVLGSYVAGVSPVKCAAGLGCVGGTCQAKGCVPYFKCTSATCSDVPTYVNFVTNVMPKLACPAVISSWPKNKACAADAAGKCALVTLTPAGGKCAAAAECEAGLECLSGLCALNKCATVRCAAGSVCENGQCRTALGGKCMSPSRGRQCATGSGCVDGVCASTGCVASVACPNGNTPSCDDVATYESFIDRQAICPAVVIPWPQTKVCRSLNGQCQLLASGPAPPKAPKGCVSYSDGCNTCSLDSQTGAWACTELACISQGTPKCLEWETTTTTTKAATTTSHTCGPVPGCAAPPQGCSSKLSYDRQGCITGCAYECQTTTIATKATTKAAATTTTSTCGPVPGCIPPPSADCITRPMLDANACTIGCRHECPGSSTTTTAPTPKTKPAPTTTAAPAKPTAQCAVWYNGCQNCVRQADLSFKCPLTRQCVRNGAPRCVSYVPPKCSVWNDGCNTCTLAANGLMGCTDRACFRQGTPYCATWDVPKGCGEWFDGCSTCKVAADGSLVGCGPDAKCTPETRALAKCTGKATTTTTTTTTAIVETTETEETTEDTLSTTTTPAKPTTTTTTTTTTSTAEPSTAEPSTAEPSTEGEVAPTTAAKVSSTTSAVEVFEIEGFLFISNLALADFDATKAEATLTAHFGAPTKITSVRDLVADRRRDARAQLLVNYLVSIPKSDTAHAARVEGEAIAGSEELEASMERTFPGTAVQAGYADADADPLVEKDTGNTTVIAIAVVASVAAVALIVGAVLFSRRGKTNVVFDKQAVYEGVTMSNPVYDARQTYDTPHGTEA